MRYKLLNQDTERMLALLGDVALKGADPQVHAHVVVGRRDGSSRRLIRA